MGVGNDEFDGDGMRVRDRGNIKRFVVDLVDNEIKCFGDSVERVRDVEDLFGVVGDGFRNGYLGV